MYKVKDVMTEGLREQIAKDLNGKLLKLRFEKGQRFLSCIILADKNSVAIKPYYESKDKMLKEMYKFRKVSIKKGLGDFDHWNDEYLIGPKYCCGVIHIDRYSYIDKLLLHVLTHKTLTLNEVNNSSGGNPICPF